MHGTVQTNGQMHYFGMHSWKHVGRQIPTVKTQNVEPRSVSTEQLNFMVAWAYN